VCKLYNKLLHAEEEEYRNTKHTMGENELRQLALDLRKKNPEVRRCTRRLPSRSQKGFTRHGNASSMVWRTSPRKRSLKYLSLVYPSEWLEAFKYQGVGQCENKEEGSFATE